MSAGSFTFWVFVAFGLGFVLGILLAMAGEAERQYEAYERWNSQENNRGQIE
jgi:hypothetical protein